MEIRRTVPDPDNKYYLKSPAGWNPCILGNPNNRLYPQSVLANCVGAAVGRFNELIGKNNCNYLGNRNPGGFLTIAKQQGLKTGTAIKPGCVVVMVKTDGSNGHVICIEKVSGGQYYTFESGWSYSKGKYINNRWVSKSANFGMSSLYKFAGVIYNPNVDPYEIPPADFSTYYTTKGSFVKFVQWALVKEGCYAKNTDDEIDGIAGPKTREAISLFQRKHGCKVDGWAGPETVGVIKKLYAIL